MPKTFQEFLGDGDGPRVSPEAVKAAPLVVALPPVTKQITVSREGELVVLRIGNASPIRFPYKEAIRLGHWLMVKGTEAKAQAGDMGKRIEVNPRAV